jgi:hypothetical protein
VKPAISALDAKVYVEVCTIGVGTESNGFTFTSPP